MTQDVEVLICTSMAGTFAGAMNNTGASVEENVEVNGLFQVPITIRTSFQSCRNQ